MVKVPMVTLFFLTGKVALKLFPWELPWRAKADPWGGGGGGGVDGSSQLHSFPLTCILRGMVLRTCVSTNTGEDDNLK